MLHLTVVAFQTGYTLHERTIYRGYEKELLLYIIIVNELYSSVASLESLQFIARFGLTENLVDTSCSKSMTAYASDAEFDDISVTAYSKDMSEATLLRLCKSAPTNLSAKEKVRYLECMAASLPIQDDSDESMYSGNNNFCLSTMK